MIVLSAERLSQLPAFRSIDVTVTPTDDDRTLRRGLSDRESRALARLTSQNQEIVTIDDLAEALDTTYDSAKATGARLASNGWLTRLKPGLYLVVPLAAGEESQYTAHEFYIASRLVEPMYVSFWSALGFHGFTEQVPRSVTVATTKRIPDRTVHGVEYHFVTLAERKFFGHEHYAVGGHEVPIATPEKALADCADQPKHCGGVRELAKGIRKGTEDYDPETLLEYARRIGNGAGLKRLVYLMDQYDVPVPDRESVETSFTKGSSPLDPTRSAAGTYAPDYRLYVNIPDGEMP
jgi:predicted transcriptional regulator of viral defense system